MGFLGFLELAYPDDVGVESAQVFLSTFIMLETQVREMGKKMGVPHKSPHIVRV